MGGVFSLRGASDRYYVSYEKAFERIDNECAKIKSRQQRRQQSRNRVNFFFFSFSAVLMAFAAAQAAWVHRQPPGTFSTEQHVARVSPVVIVPLMVYIGHWVVSFFFNWSESRGTSKLKKLAETKRKMVKQLKDSTRFDKTMALIKKYDPEFYEEFAVNGTPLPGQPPFSGLNKRPPGQGPGRTPGGLMAKTGANVSAAAVMAAAGAGKVLLPMFDKLASSVIGDSPVLLEELRQAQTAALAQDRENAALRKENAALRAQLRELQGLPPCDSTTDLSSQQQDEEEDSEPDGPDPRKAQGQAGQQQQAAARTSSSGTASEGADAGSPDGCAMVTPVQAAGGKAPATSTTCKQRKGAQPGAPLMAQECR